MILMTTITWTLDMVAKGEDDEEFIIGEESPLSRRPTCMLVFMMMMMMMMMMMTMTKMPMLMKMIMMTMMTMGTICKEQCQQEWPSCHSWIW